MLNRDKLVSCLCVSHWLVKDSVLGEKKLHAWEEKM